MRLDAAQKRNNNCHTHEMKNSRQNFERNNVRNDSVPCQPSCDPGQRFPNGTIGRGGIFPIWILEERVLRKAGNQIAKRIGSVHTQYPAVENIVIDVAGIERSHEQERDDQCQRTADDDPPGCFAGGLTRGTQPQDIEKTNADKRSTEPPKTI